MIRYDPVRPTAGTLSVVAICTCGWRALANDHAGADSLAMRHVDVAHPAPSLDRERAITASRVRRHRRDTP